MASPLKPLLTFLLLVLLGSLTNRTVSADELTTEKPNSLQLPSANEIDRIIADLDHAKFSVRSAAYDRLESLGPAALPALQQVFNSPLPEQRYRARALVTSLTRTIITESMSKLGKQPDDKFDLDEGVWLITQFIHPNAQRELLVAELDRLAEALQAEIGADVKAAEMPPQEFVAALEKVMFKTEEFGGEIEKYDHPYNSSLYHALKTKQALPIILSYIVVEVCERVGAPVVGIPVAGRFMAKYDGSKAPIVPGAPDDEVQEDIIVDPFGQRSLSLTQFKNERGGSIYGIEPGSNREVLDRMFNNLVHDYDAIHDTERAEEAEALQRLIEKPLLENER